jgi:hypothetical protein
MARARRIRVRVERFCLYRARIRAQKFRGVSTKIKDFTKL